MKMFLISCFYFLLILYVYASPNEDLSRLEESLSEWILYENPEFASYLNDRRYDDRLDDYSLDIFERWKGNVSEFLSSLKAIPRKELSMKRKIDYDILKDYLQTYLKGYHWRMYNALNPIDVLSGPQFSLRNMVNVFKGMTEPSKEDFEKFLERLKQIPRQIEQMKKRMKKAVKLKHTHHNVSVDSVPDMLDKLITEKAEDSMLYSPFKEELKNISSITKDEKKVLRHDAKSAIKQVMESLKKLKKYMEDTYLKHTRQGIGLNALENGAEYYKACLKFRLSLPLSPEEVHQTGLDEVERISAEMEKIFLKLGIHGSIKEGFDTLKKDPKYFLKTGEEMVNKYDEIINNQIKSKLPLLFRELPNIPVIVRASQNDGVFARYFAPTSDGSKPGVFQLNAFHPDQTPVFTFMAIALHEANPGHHLQTSIQKTSDMPGYRKDMIYSRFFQIPTTFPAGSAFSEGWALYAEYLGEEMGLYQTDVDLLGRYSMEIFRACRLVVDTGLHYFNWTRDQAVEYLGNYTSMGESEIAFEVNRYLTIPGQACSYKIGELMFKELRNKSEQELGEKFDIREFHSVVLSSGRMSLSTLEMVVNHWIEDVKQRPFNKGYLHIVPFGSVVCFVVYAILIMSCQIV